MAFSLAPGDLNLIVECCHNCYLHEQQGHSEAEFTHRLAQLQDQLARTWHGRTIRIHKNKQGQPRLGAFEIKYKRVRVFSKLAHGNFANSYDICNLLVVLDQKEPEQLDKLSKKLGSEDIFTYLRSRITTIKMSIKSITVEVNKLLGQGVAMEKLKLACTQLDKQGCMGQTTRAKTSRMMSTKRKCKPTPSHRLQEVEKQNEQPCKSIRQGEKEQSMTGSRNSRYKSARKMSRNSLLQSRFGNKTLLKMSSMVRQEGPPPKYQYLSKEMDVSYRGWLEEEDQDFQLMELSEEENDQPNETRKNELQQRKIDEGLNFNLTASYGESNGNRRYSFEYKKFAQLLEQEMKQQEQGKQKKSLLFQQSKNKTCKGESDSSSDDLEKQPSVYEIDKRDLVSRRDLWAEAEAKNEEEELKQEQGSIIKDSNPLTEVNQDITIDQKVQPDSLNESQLLIYEVARNYVEGRSPAKIDGLGQQLPEKQVYVDVHYLSALLPLAQAILALHKAYPNHFENLLHNPDLHAFRLSPTPTLNRISLFNPLLGLFQTLSLKVQLSSPHPEDWPAWVIVVCQAVLQVLATQDHCLHRVLRVLTGVPVVTVNAVDLRKVKRIIVDGNLVNPSGRKGQVLCTRDAGEADSLHYCQLVSFEKNKDFLQSQVSYIESGQQKRKSYQQFVLEYQNLNLFLFKDGYFHNQTCIGVESATHPQSWNIEILLDQPTELFLQFSEHEKLEKPNHILIEKVADSLREPIGSLNKKGNFFFELILEPALYCITIRRAFEAGETNSVHFYSSNQVLIRKSELVYLQ